MKRILFSVGIGSLALALMAWGHSINDTRPGRARARPTANVPAARPANTGAMMGAHRYAPAAQFRQRTYMAPRARSNAVVNQNARVRAFPEQKLLAQSGFSRAKQR